MTTIILVIHLLIAVTLIIVVLLQRSEGGALGIGGGGGMSGFMTSRATANLLTRVTSVLAACFMATSLALALLVSGAQKPVSIVEEPAASAPAEPEVPSVPAGPEVPSAPLAQ
ncbi:MAG: preprotein translocase subunit SecG [Alphaproteobacteria bacterium]